MSVSSSSAAYQTQREVYRHKLMFELMFRDDEQVDLKRYIRAFVSSTSSLLSKVICFLQDMRLSRNTAFSKIPCGPVIVIDKAKIASWSTSNSKYKTELCKYYVETGVCKFDGDCTFAHGAEDLRNANHKSVLCRLFHMTNNCPYGKMKIHSTLESNGFFFQVRIVHLFMTSIDVHRLLLNQVIPMHRSTFRLVVIRHLLTNRNTNSVHDVQVQAMHPWMNNYLFECRVN